jgi:hypothetical protein
MMNEYPITANDRSASAYPSCEVVPPALNVAETLPYLACHAKK